MATTAENLGMTTTLAMDMAGAEAKVTEVLKAEGFGILTEIDIQATFKKKLDVDYRPYKILGACNPNFAHKALNEMSAVGLLLPCNVTLSEVGENQVEVSIIDPISMLGVVDNDAIAELAGEVREKLERTFNNLAS